MPRAADDGDALEALRSAARMVSRMWASRWASGLVAGEVTVAQGAHRFEDAREESLLAPFRAARSGAPTTVRGRCSPQPREHPIGSRRRMVAGVSCAGFSAICPSLAGSRHACRQRLLLRLHLGSACELDRLRQVHEARRDVVLEGVAQRLPLR